MIKLPNKCLRKNWNYYCNPLSQIQSTCKKSFICCGISDKDTRTQEQDKFRLCFVNDSVDEMSDYDKRDLLDTISVITKALSIDENMIQNGEEL